MGSLVRTTEFLDAASMSANTRRAYRGALRAIDAWLRGRDLNDALLATYLAALFDTGRAYASATMCLCAVRKRAAWYDLPDSRQDHESNAAGIPAQGSRTGSGSGPRSALC